MVCLARLLVVTHHVRNRLGVLQAQVYVVITVDLFSCGRSCARSCGKRPCPCACTVVQAVSVIRGHGWSGRRNQAERAESGLTGCRR